MHKPIATIAGTALALLIGTTSVAAVNPLGVDHTAATVVGAMTSTAGQVMSNMGDWARGWQMTPGVHDPMTPVVGPSAVPGMHARATQMTQTHVATRTQARATQGPGAASTPAALNAGSPWSATDAQTTGGMGMGMSGPRGGSH